jgi:NAD-dependent SIR2 family protein deacetylase
MTENFTAAASYALEYAKGVIEGKALAVLTGAGLSTDSGIPDYRGEGRVARHPMTFDNFMGGEAARSRYWARSFVGWSRIASAEPNAGHFAIALAEKTGWVQQIITQNVDRLHQKAGASKVIDLHGRLDMVRCVGCGFEFTRNEMDLLLQAANPGLEKDPSIEFTPDGDAEIEFTEGFVVPACPSCSGILKPDVVFFGETVPVSRVEASIRAVEQADVLLVAGSSLAVNSGYRFAKLASKAGKPVVIVNLGPTKADPLATVKLELGTSLALPELFK